MALPADSNLALDIDRGVLAHAARDFDGATQYLSQNPGAFDPDPSGDWYWAGWVWVGPGAGNNARLMAVEADSTPLLYMLWVDTGALSIQYNPDGLGDQGTTGNAGDIPVGSWRLVEVAYTVADQTFRAYVDRVLHATRVLIRTPSRWYAALQRATLAAWYTGTAPLACRLSTVMCVHGAVPTDDERDDVYNHGIGLSADRVKHHPTLGAKLAHLWPIQEAAGGADDAVGSMPFTAEGAPVHVEGVTENRAWNFLKASDQSLTSDPTTEFGESEFTVIALMRSTNTGTQYIASKWDTSANRCWALLQADFVRSASFRVTESGGTHVSATDGSVIEPDEWGLMFGKHKDGEAPRVRYNGRAEVVGGTAITSIHQANVCMTVGARSTSLAPSPSDDWDGDIQWVLHVGRRTTDAEDAWLYNGGLFRSLAEIQCAAYTGVGPGKDIWPNVVHAYKGGSSEDLIRTNAVDLTEVNAPAVVAADVTNRMAADVSKAGLDHQGDPCGVWRYEDQSGRDNHGTQGTFGYRPLYVPGIGVGSADGEVYLEFPDGSILSGTEDFSLYTYLECSDINAPWWQNSLQFGNDELMFAAHRTTGKWSCYRGAVQTSTTTVVVDTKYVVTFLADKASSPAWRLRIDGVQEGGGTLTSVPISDDTRRLLDGGISAAPDEYLKGFVMRVAVFATEHTGTDITDAEDWVKNGDAPPAGIEIEPDTLPLVLTLPDPTVEVGTPLGTFVEDTFTDLDGTLLTDHVGEVGAAWAVATGSAQVDAEINANRAHGISTGKHWYYASGVPPLADYSVEIDVVQLTDARTRSVTVLGRLDPLTRSGYGALYDRGANEVRLMEFGNGTGVERGAYPLSLDPTGQARLRLVIDGDQVSVYVNGILRIGPWTDATPMTDAGRVGLYLDVTSEQSALNGLHLDNLNAYTGAPPEETVAYPGTLPLTLALPDPAVANSQPADPGTLGLVLTLPDPVVTLGGVVVPDTLPLTLSLPAPEALAGEVVVPGVLGLELALPDPTVLLGGAVAPDTLALELVLPDPVVETGLVVFPDTLALVLALPHPTAAVTPERWQLLRPGDVYQQANTQDDVYRAAAQEGDVYTVPEENPL